MKRKVFIVDDHPIMRRGYVNLINEEPDLTVSGDAGTAQEALEQLAGEYFDLAIVDITLEGGMSGLELIKQLSVLYPDLPMLVISMHEESLYADRALRAGAKGYIMKNKADTLIIEAIQRLLRGGYYFSDVINDKIMRRYSGRPTGQESSIVHELSDRQLEVFTGLGRGLSTIEIAEKMVVSPKTVETYRSRIKEKLAVDSTTELIQRAVQWVQNEGLI